MCQLQKLSSKYNELILLGNSIKKDDVVLLKKTHKTGQDKC